MYYGRPHLQAWMLPDLNTIPNNCVGENSMVMVLFFCPGVPGSNPARTLYFWHAFIHLFLCNRLCSQDTGPCRARSICTYDVGCSNITEKADESQ